VAANLAKFDVGDRQVPIRVQLDENARTDRHLLEALKVATASGAAVPLSAVADFEMSQGPTAIDRYDRTRRIVIGADLVGDAPLGDVVNALMKTPAAKTLPAGVELKQFGAAEIMAEVFESFAQAMIAGLMMVYAVLVLLFGSFLQPITILFSLPLSIGGAIVALAIAQKAVSLPVVIGILMLMGIVTKNAIMLVDFAIEEMARGVPRTEAIIDAGRKRARPIIMTTIAMVGGMIPAALAVGSGGEFRSPMAVAVIGGLISSTLLSLVFVPAVFAVMDDFGSLTWRIFSRFVGATDEPPQGLPQADQSSPGAAPSVLHTRPVAAAE
jgi:multidrug efflux pump subunit AcrB